MGMAAIAMRGSDVDYQRMGIWKLREIARQSSERHDPEAARVFVARILDIEVERRTVHQHENQGWHTANPLVNAGNGGGGGEGAPEPLAALYDRGIYTHEQHEAARRWIDAARVKPRQLLAALLQAAKMHPRSSSDTPWAKSYDHMADHIDWYAKAMGFEAAGQSFDCIENRQTEAGGSRRVRTSHQVPVFKNGEALRQAGKVARTELLLLASV